jgi:hypothetical protein
LKISEKNCFFKSKVVVSPQWPNPTHTQGKNSIIMQNLEKILSKFTFLGLYKQTVNRNENVAKISFLSLLSLEIQPPSDFLQFLGLRNYLKIFFFRKLNFFCPFSRFTSE